MVSIRAALGALGAAMVLSACASTAGTMPRQADGALVNEAGMTLYTFDKDVAGSGKSACAGPCATMWPAVPATAATYAAPYSVVVRDDGTRQLARNGKPLYLYAQDTRPGERNGDNVKNVWHIVTD
ncbi:COG4315 family predicted lipoprotein [Massilia sp. GCM10023247]|uniref:COG4315 family predicted lipoprotein n=1 Tax=Massilia sp. GCM10023247 TaxID=3252643 RepID=UPI003618BF55